MIRDPCSGRRGNGTDELADGTYWRKHEINRRRTCWLSRAAEGFVHHLERDTCPCLAATSTGSEGTSLCAGHSETDQPMRSLMAGGVCWIGSARRRTEGELRSYSQGAQARTGTTRRVMGVDDRKPLRRFAPIADEYREVALLHS